jgi:hypothetical protein
MAIAYQLRAFAIANKFSEVNIEVVDICLLNLV